MGESDIVRVIGVSTRFSESIPEDVWLFSLCVLEDFCIGIIIEYRTIMGVEVHSGALDTTL